MTAAAPATDALGAVRKLERTLDACERARADAERILEHARAEARTLIADARERGERAARERRDEVLAAASQQASEALADAEAFGAEFAGTLARRQEAIAEALQAIVVPEPDGTR